MLVRMKKSLKVTCQIPGNPANNPGQHKKVGKGYQPYVWESCQQSKQA
jgi:hypothetical protein